MIPFVVIGDNKMEVGEMMKLADRYGVSLFMLCLFIFATVYILRRLLNDRNGILTGYVRQTTETMNALGTTSREQSQTLIQAVETQKKEIEILEKFEVRLDGLEKTVTGVESQIDQTIKEKRYKHKALTNSTTALALCFREACKIAEEIAEKLEISNECKPYIDKMQKQIDDHVAVTCLSPVQEKEKK